MGRVSWAEYFMGIAHAVSARGTCDRKHVGCVLVVDKRIVATGYNGSPPGFPHCDDAGHDMLNGNCVRTLHAEQNAVVQAARFGVSLLGAEVFVNTFPCWICAKTLFSAGVVRVYFDDDYRNDQRVADAAHLMKVELVPPARWRGHQPPPGSDQLPPSSRG